MLFYNVYSCLTNTCAVSANIESETAEEKKAPQVCNQAISYLKKRETELKQDSELLTSTDIKRTRFTDRENASVQKL